MKKRDCIIKTVQAHFTREVPMMIAEVKAIDLANGNKFCASAIDKEIKNSLIVFKFLGESDPPPSGWNKIDCHMVFNVKFDLYRKAFFVTGGHMTKDTGVSTYTSVCIGFIFYTLNGLDILAGNIQIAYLNNESLKKNYFYAREEFSANQGHVVLIVCALYDQKSAGAAWCAKLADTLETKLGFNSCLSNPDVWYKPNVNSNGRKYYAYLFVYTDDILVTDINPYRYMFMIVDSYPVKKNSIRHPKIYLESDCYCINFQQRDDSPITC